MSAHTFNIMSRHNMNPLILLSVTRNHKMSLYDYLFYSGFTSHIRFSHLHLHNTLRTSISTSKSSVGIVTLKKTG